jgi:hypothetical protein
MILFIDILINFQLWLELIIYTVHSSRPSCCRSKFVLVMLVPEIVLKKVSGCLRFCHSMEDFAPVVTTWASSKTTAMAEVMLKELMALSNGQPCLGQFKMTANSYSYICLNLKNNLPLHYHTILDHISCSLDIISFKSPNTGKILLSC